MSKFVIVPDNKFEVIYIAFDNSNDEMEYTKYVKSDVTTDSFEPNEKDSLITSLLDEMYQPINTISNDVLINTELDEVSIIVFLKNAIVSYTYEEDDGGVEEIPDNSEDIYKSRFDDMHEAINSFIGTKVNKQFIYEIEE